MDERTLKIIVKFDNDTGAGMAAVLTELLTLAGERGLAGVTREAEKASKSATTFFDRLAGAIPGMRIFGVSLAGEVVAGLGAAIFGLAPYVVALGALLMNWLSMGALLAIGGGAILGLMAAFVGLGGGATRTSALATANNQVAAAAEAHENAVRKLQEGYVAWNSTATHTQLELMRLQDLQERVADTAAKLQQAQAKQGDAQADVSPVALKVGADFGGMMDALRDKMRPGADLILTWLDNMIPKVGAVGLALVDWFSSRIPKALDFFGTIVDKVLSGKGGFGAAIGNVVDYVLAHKAEFISFFMDVFNTASNVFAWLMTAFINIHEWFKKSWPTILGFIKSFQDGVTFWGPLLKPVLKDIGDHLGNIFKNISALQPLWGLMGFAIGSMVAVAIGPLDSLLLVLDNIITALKWIEGHANNTTNQYGGHWLGKTWIPNLSGPITGQASGSGGSHKVM